MKNKKGAIIPLLLAVAFVATISFGVYFKESGAAYYGSSTGLGSPGDPLYSVPILYDKSQNKVLGYYQDTVGGLDVVAAAFAWVYQQMDIPGNSEQNGYICGIAWNIAPHDYYKICNNGSGWTVEGDAPLPYTPELRIINVVTDNLTKLHGY